MSAAVPRDAAGAGASIGAGTGIGAGAGGGADTSATAAPHEHSESLSHRRLGVGSLVFMIIAASAPLTVLAGGVPSSFGVTGVLGVPLGYLVLGGVLALFAVGYGAMSASIHNAGAFYAYITAGLGVRQGIGASILALVSYNAMQVGLYGLFGFSLSSALSALVGLDLPWFVSAVIGWVIVGAMGMSRVDLSAKAIAVLVALEFLVVAIVDVLSLVVAPESVSTAALQPSAMLVPGIGAMLAFGVAAFMGFESGAVYAEETRDPQRSVSRATFIAVSIIAVFYAFSSWALSVGIGPSKILDESAAQGPDLVFAFLTAHAPAYFADVANILFITSLLAALSAFHNAAARYFFALGRTGVIPRLFDRTSASSGAPIAGSLAQSALALVVVMGFAIAGLRSPDGPLFPVLTLFSWLTNAAAFGLVFLLAVTSFAIIGYFRRDGQGLGLFTRVIAPLLAGLALTAVFVLILVNFDVLIGSSSPLLVVVMPAIILASGALGLVRGEYLRRVRPEVFRAAAEDLDEEV